MSVIAVAGKMASGKNYICSQMEKEGWCSVDADLLVHKAIEQNNDLIISTFQTEAAAMNLKIKNEDGSVNRRELGKLLFAKPELLARQESIVYPAVTQMVKDFAAAHEKTIINATVLFKTPELLNMCEYVVFVKASLFKRIIRARKRDNLPYKQIFKRFYAQRNLLKEYVNSGADVRVVKN